MEEMIFDKWRALETLFKTREIGGLKYFFAF